MLLVLLVPAVMALVPVVMRTQRSTIVVAALLTGSALLGLASIGIVFIPTVALAWVAVGASGHPEVDQQPYRSPTP